MENFGISKLSFNNKRVESICVAPIDSEKSWLGDFEDKDQNWLKQQFRNRKTFHTLSKNKKGKWIIQNKITYDFLIDQFEIGCKMPQNLIKRKTFLSYYHNDDQIYKEYFENLFDDLIINKSLQDNDIDSDNSDEYVKQLIQKNIYMIQQY